MHIVYKSEPERGRIWQRWLAEHAPDIHLHIWPETGDPDQVEALVAWQPPADIPARFPHLKLLFPAPISLTSVRCRPTCQ